jgi:hypothetical protein
MVLAALRTASAYLEFFRIWTHQRKNLFKIRDLTRKRMQQISNGLRLRSCYRDRSGRSQGFIISVFLQRLCRKPALVKTEDDKVDLGNTNEERNLKIRNYMLEAIGT